MTDSAAQYPGQLPQEKQYYEEEYYSESRSYYSSDSPDYSPREGRILTFADEHGKSICQVRFYEVEEEDYDDDEDTTNTKSTNASGCGDVCTIS